MLLFSKSVSSTHADKCFLGILLILSKVKTSLIYCKYCLRWNLLDLLSWNLLDLLVSARGERGLMCTVCDVCLKEGAD